MLVRVIGKQRARAKPNQVLPGRSAAIRSRAPGADDNKYREFPQDNRN